MMKMNVPFVVVLMLMVWVNRVQPNLDAVEATNCERDIISHVLLNYSKAAVPPPSGADVYVEMHIQEISTLSEIKSLFELDVLFSAVWLDRRLLFPNFRECPLTNITLDLDIAQKLWNPNMCILNSKEASVHRSPNENLMMILYSNGTVWQNFRMRVTAPCAIDLRKFPFDQQKCSMLIESYSYNVQRVRLAWMEEHPITFMHNVSLPDFLLERFRVSHQRQSYPNGEWDQLTVTFTFKRQYGFFVLQAYIPTLMTMSVAWLSMWMDHRQVSARATLDISAFLALSLQYGNIIRNQPPVSYVKSLDIWMLGCIVFMFAVIAELTIISYMQRVSMSIVSTGEQSPAVGRRLASDMSQSRNISPNPLIYAYASAGHQMELGMLKGDAKLSAPLPPLPPLWTTSPDELDRICRLLYVAIFMAFTFFYCVIFIFM